MLGMTKHLHKMFEKKITNVLYLYIKNHVPGIALWMEALLTVAHNANLNDDANKRHMIYA